MLDSGPNEPQVPGNFCRQLTRVSKIAFFSQLEPFAKRPKRIGFSKFKMPSGSFLNGVHKCAVGFRFRQNSFFAILFLDLEFCHNFQKRNLLRCRPRPAVHRCGVRWSPPLPNSSSPAAKFPANSTVAFYDLARRGPSPTARTGGSAAEGRGCNDGHSFSTAASSTAFERSRAESTCSTSSTR